MSEVREDVVDALVAAHLTEDPAFALAAVEFEVTPAPTDLEREEARARVLRTMGGHGGGLDA